MPKIVDHADRRIQIIEGLIQIAGRDGLHAVTMRSVAAEAGTSVRLVQYYFETKARLMNAALEHLELESNMRWASRLDQSLDHQSVRAILETFIEEALPTDAQSQTFHLVWTSFAMLAMADPDLASQPFIDGPKRLEQRLSDVLEQARTDGKLAPNRDASVEAARLLTITHGLGTSILIGQRTAGAAMEVLRYHLDRLLES